MPLASSKDIKKPSLLKNNMDSSEKLRVSEMRSTEHSLVKKRSKLTIEVGRREEVRKEKARGVSFDSSIGHQYLREVE